MTQRPLRCGWVASVCTLLFVWGLVAAAAWAQELEQEEVRVLAGRARAAYALGDHEKAFESFEEALKLQPDLLPLRQEYAQKLQAAGFYDRAE